MSLKQRIAFHSRLKKCTFNSESWYSKQEKRTRGDRASFTTVALQPNISSLNTILTSSIHSRCKQCNTDSGSCNLDKRTWRRRLFTGVSATKVFKRSFLFVRGMYVHCLSQEDNNNLHTVKNKFARSGSDCNGRH